VRRWTIVVVVTVSLVLVGGAAVVGARARRDRVELFARFAAERQRRLEEATAAIAKELAAITTSLRVMSRILGAAATTEEQRLELHAVMAVSTPYLLIEVHDSAGRRLLAVTDRRGGPGFAPDAFAAAMAQAAGRAASLAPGALSVAPPRGGDSQDWARIFAVALPRGSDGRLRGVIVALVDLAPIFAPLRQLAAAPGDSLLVLGPADRPLPLSSRAFQQWGGPAELAALSPRLGRLVSEMRAGRRGTLALGDGEARRAGLGPDPLVAAYAPIPMSGGGSWSVATFSSTAAVRARERAAMLRLGLVSAVLAFCLVGLGGFIVFASRRALTLREHLRHADEIAR
jgi:two-component system sensor histidine kinase HydH